MKLYPETVQYEPVTYRRLQKEPHVFIKESDLMEFLLKIEDANDFCGVRGISYLIDDTTRKWLEEKDIALHSQGRGWYPGKNFAQFIEDLGWSEWWKDFHEY